MRLRKPAQPVTGSELPADLAHGPDPRVWCPHDRGDLDHGLSVEMCRYRASSAWRAAGHEWSQRHGLGFGGWRDLLPEDVRYTTSALGRAHHRHGGLVAPWEKTSRPPARTTAVDHEDTNRSW